MGKARKNGYNQDLPEERITLRVLKNYSKMQEELLRLRKKVQEQGDKLMEYHNRLQKLHSKDMQVELEKFKKLQLERDELLEKNKCLQREVRFYEGLKKYFTNELNKKEVDDGEND